MDREGCANETDCEFSLGTMDSRKSSARRRTRANKITESPELRFEIVEIVPNVIHRDFCLAASPCKPQLFPFEVSTMTEILMPWPLSDEWIDIGGEG